MKILTRLATALMLLSFSVVVEILSAATSDSIPVGTAFPPVDSTRILVAIIDNTYGTDNTSSTPDVQLLRQKDFRYNPDSGDLEKVVSQALKDVLRESSGPKVGEDGHDYRAFAVALYYIPKVEGYPDIFGPLGPEVSVCYTSYRVVYQNDRWVAKISPTPPTFQPYMAFAVPGLKWVEVNAEVGGSRYTISSENGTPPDCSLARGGGNYVGPNVAYMANLAFPSSPTAKKVTGSYKIFLSDDRLIWKEYDLATGQLVAQSDKQLVVASDLKLLITPAQVVRVASGERNSSTSAQAFQLEVLGGTAGKTVTIEYSEDLVLWQTLTVLPSTSSISVTTIDTGSKARFYRAKLE